jgi:hypothetical protein
LTILFRQNFKKFSGQVGVNFCQNFLFFLFFQLFFVDFSAFLSKNFKKFPAPLPAYFQLLTGKLCARKSSSYTQLPSPLSDIIIT